MSRQVLVTGASKGIGKAIAIQLAKDGFEIAVHYMGDKQGAEDTLKSITELGGAGRLIRFDISNRSECREKLESDIAEHGAYYGVVNNAGITRDTAFPAMTEEEWDGVGVAEAEDFVESPETGVEIESLKRIAKILYTIPEGHSIYRKTKKILRDRQKMVEYAQNEFSEEKISAQFLNLYHQALHHD